MTPTLRQFLETGKLGAIALGMSPLEVMEHLGDPTAQSLKQNPLILRYGPLELSFLNRKSDAPQLMQIAVSLDNPEAPPASIGADGLGLAFETTWEQFEGLLEEAGLHPEEKVRRQGSGYILMPSGVRASFAQDRLNGFLLSRRTREENRAPSLNDEREPSLEEIRMILDQARAVTKLDVKYAGLVLAWAAVEAAMRRLALKLGLKGRVGTQSATLMRELFAARRLNADDMQFIETSRQLRSAVVHGLRPPAIDEASIFRLIGVAEGLIESSSGVSPRSETASG